MPGILGDVLGFISGGRAAKSQSDAQIAAEHGVLGATASGQQDVLSQFGYGQQGVNTATQEAIGNVSQYGNLANNYQQGNLNTQTGALSPFIAAGQAGATGLQNYAASNPTFNFAPTQAQLEATPGYQFQLQSALGATQNAAAAAGSGAGSNANLDLQKTAAGIAGEYYQNAFNNAQQTFQTNQNTKLANLSTLAGIGLSGTGQQGTSLAQLGNPIGANIFNTGLYGGNALTNAAMFNADTGLKANEFAADLGLRGANLAGQYAVGAGNAHAGGIISQYNNLAGLGSDIPGALTAFGG